MFFLGLNIDLFNSGKIYHLQEMEKDIADMEEKKSYYQYSKN